MAGTSVERIKERLNIVEVISGYMELRPAGRHFKGKSPFTNEKTPSFFVSPERGMYYCFSSGKGGDLFTFIEEMEGVDFKGALRILAERAHVELTREDPRKRNERETLYAILEAATAYFEAALKARGSIREYLRGRGVSDESVAKWRIGYAPGPPESGWRNLKERLAEKGFSEAMALRAGLIKHAAEKDSLYDVFRNRVMFPICDSAGRVVAFSGRAMAGDPAVPKYVNSPETELYEKSYILFGYHLAKQSIRKSTFSLIVEGQFDLVLAHQAGFRNAVALSGTALSPAHLGLLERLSPRVVLALDADRAGIASVQRSAHLALGRGMDVKVALLPEGRDPADLVQENPELLRRAVRSAETVVEFLIGALRRAARDERALRLLVRDQVLPLIARIPSRIDREHFEQVVSAALSLTPEAVHHEVARILETPQGVVLPAPAPHTRGAGAPETPKKYRTDELARFLYGVILAQEAARKSGNGDSSEPTLDSAELVGALRGVLGADAWQSMEDLAEQEKNKLIFETERHTAELAPSALLSHFHMLLRELETRLLRQALRAARTKLREAEAAGDESAASERLAESAVLQKRLSALSAGV